MKIIHIAFSDHFGGANISAFRIHESLKLNNIDSKIVVLDRSEKNKKNKDVILYKSNKTVSHRLKNYFARILNLLIRNNCQNSFNIFDSGIANYVNNLNVDLINLHWINNEMISLKEISEIKKPIVWTLHDMWAFCGSEHYTNQKRFIKGYNNSNDDTTGIDIPKFLWLKKKKYFKKKNINFIAPSKWMLNNLKQSNLFKKNKKYLIRSPVNVYKQKFQNLKKIKKDNKIKFIFCAYNCFSDRRKGFQVLKKVLNSFQNIFDFELITIGENKNNYDGVKFKIRNLGYLSSQKKILRYFQEANALLIPSISDNFPNVATEALSSGLPVICSKNCGSSEIIKNYENGIVLNSFDKKNFKKIFKWIQSKKINKTKIIKNLIKIAGYDKTCKDYLKVYKKVLNA